MSDKEKKYGGSISQLIFSDGRFIDLEEDDIVVFVGPNNVGKSQALRDIYELTESQRETLVVSEIKIKKEENDLREFFSKISVETEKSKTKQYDGYKFQAYSVEFDGFLKDKAFSRLRNAFVSYLGTNERLSICNPPEIINRDAPPMHPIHYIALHPDVRKKISKYFKMAFGKGLVPNTLFGRTVPLVMVDEDTSQLEKAPLDAQDYIEEYGELLGKCPQIHAQGDGIKSFTGIMLNLVMGFYRIFLIDEPESFLHPPQARIMGHIIGDLLKDNQQCFISTHSADIIRGLLEKCPKRVKLVRITRMRDDNFLSILDNDSLLDLWKDPILKYSEVMSAIFHKNVVVCESDSDCKFYSIIEEHLKEEEGLYSETLFLHSGGKDRMHSIIKALESLGVSYRAVLDIDILNDEGKFKRIIESAGADWKIFEKDVKNFSNSMKVGKKRIEREALSREINAILNESSEKYIDSGEVKRIRDAIKTESQWEMLKKHGAEGAPNAECYIALTRIIDNAKKSGIFIVPVGELERFIPAVGGEHGPGWVDKVISEHPDYRDEVYSKAREFVKSWGL